MKITYSTILGCVLALITGGCATNQPLPPGLRTEAQSAGGVKILSVGLLQDDDGLLIHGTVQRQFGYFGSAFRHLDVEVRGTSGERLANQPINFFPNPIPFDRLGAGRASYTLRLATVPPPNSTIRVAVDCTLLSKCELAHAPQ